MSPVLRSSAAHVFVESVDHPVADDGDEHHLFRVLRLRDGETITVSDGRGRWRATTATGGGLVPVGEVMEIPRPPECTIAAAVPKGDRLEWMVQKLTEVGATRIVLLDTARGVVRWDATRGGRQIERLTRVVREAASQSRRCWLPQLEGPRRVADVLAESGATLADPAGDPLPTRVPAGPVVIGPEGGFDLSELDAADRSGVGRVSLGDGVLRVETAAVVAAALIVALQAARS
jgi:16S rRNA (uracil1498-N3)-methyltransferase